jgi:hypothetical protein
MADAQTQSYASHARYFPLFHFVTFPILAINVLTHLYFLVRGPNRWSIWGLIVAIGLVLLAWTTRTMVNRVQDRVIRLEERLRLSQLLPADLRSRIPELRTNQLIAMRFCDDAEVPELCRAVLNGELKTNDEIKRRIKSWKPDYLRA